MIAQLFPKILQSFADAQSVIICIPSKPTLDIVASACALALFLEQYNTATTAVSPQPISPATYPCIPHTSRIQTISQHTNTSPPTHSPLICSIGCEGDKDVLSMIQQYRLSKKIHIIHNEKDTTYLAVSDIITHLFISSNVTLPKEVGTILLAGIISKTNKLKHPFVGSDLLSRVGWLLNNGADRKKVVQDIYQKKCLVHTRFYGSLLGHTSYDMVQKILWITPPQNVWQVNYQPEPLETLFDALYEHVSCDIAIIILVQKENTQTLALFPKTADLFIPKQTDGFLVQKNDTYVSILFENGSIAATQHFILSNLLPNII